MAGTPPGMAATRWRVPPARPRCWPQGRSSNPLKTPNTSLALRSDTPFALRPPSPLTALSLSCDPRLALP
ncbi:hypothetical protein K466DRAFT_592935 [Polyporus arcularius HHB13444]|uniref:Uncharacterized protein n=1 Tax=Polyporus arcularius HHB13444 TaxID=1314778 RepID=A0A5C3NWX7_9APHY|nr:hypothetical protein K466DRAFT_592935 [Polyporus arcularius HHB13444]